MSQKEDANIFCKRLANTCVQSAKTAYGVDLDYTLASLDGLEKILQAMHHENKAKPISDEGLSARCCAIGSYIGEVLRREAKDGSWSRDSDFGKDTFPLIFPKNQQLFPMAWARKRILNGSEDNVVFKAKVLLSTQRGEGPIANRS